MFWRNLFDFVKINAIFIPELSIEQDCLQKSWKLLKNFTENRKIDT